MLPSTPSHDASLARRRRRRLLRFLVLGAVLTTILLGTLWRTRRAPSTSGILARIRAAERDLPQHNLALPVPEGGHGRFVRFSNQLKGQGWNNVLGEIMFNVDLAHESHRAYVFEDFTWPGKHYPYNSFGDTAALDVFAVLPWAPAHTTPLSALVSGPLVGGPWDAGDAAPRAVSADFWERACPPEERHVLFHDALKLHDGPGDAAFAHAARALRDAPGRCVEVAPRPDGRDDWPQVFDMALLGSPRFVPLAARFLNSSASRLLGSSALVRRAVADNAHLFREPRPRSRSAAPPLDADPFAGTMAVHIRRGDFATHCSKLMGYTWSSWNMWPAFADNFDVPADAMPGHASAATLELYRRRCYPTEAEILERIRTVRREHLATAPGAPLDVLYVATNADARWVATLRAPLLRDGWRAVVSLHDFALDEAQNEVGNAVDMEVARRAALFVGNGWSTFTSNINHRRLVDERPQATSRFW